MLQQLQGPLGGGELLVMVHLLGHGAHLQLGGMAGAAVFQTLRQLPGHLPQNIHQQGVENAALAVENHFHRLLMGIGGLIDTCTGERVVHVRQGHNLS